MRPEHLHRLAVLAEIADTGSLSATARRLGVVKSSISHHVSELERDVGAKVLHRSGRGVALTAVGEALAKHGRAIVKEAADAVIAAKEAEAPRGTLRISMPAGIADASLIPMLAAFLDRYPAISIEAVATDQILDLVAEQIDVAFRIGGVDDGPFIARGLTRDRNIFVAAPAYIERAPRIAIPADLARHPLLGFAAFGKRQSFQLEGRDGARAEVEMICRVTTTSGLAIKHWALAGAGVARFPGNAVRDDLHSGRLMNVLPEYTNPHPPLSVVYMPERFRPANVRRLIEHAVAFFDRDNSNSD